MLSSRADVAGALPGSGGEELKSNCPDPMAGALQTISVHWHTTARLLKLALEMEQSDDDES